jgi:hypothetical protein
MKSWKRNMLRRYLLHSSLIFHFCSVERNPHPGGGGAAFQIRWILRMVDIEILSLLVYISWAGKKKVKQISMKAWDLGQQRSNVTLDRKASGD